MSRITSKLQVTIPKHVADLFGLAPGAEIEWIPEGSSLRVLVPGSRPVPSVPERLALFDAASERLRARGPVPAGALVEDRGWSREELYGTRGRR